MLELFEYPYTFKLESGESLRSLRIAYIVSGNPNASETVWVCHALSGNANVQEWWPGLFGVNQIFDPQKYRTICANVVGSCYGTTGPEDEDNPSQFPLISIRDMVQAHELLRAHLNIDKIDVLIGASLGGQQALEWAITAPDAIKKLILIATNALHSPFGKAFNEAQRMALKADPTFGEKGGGAAGLEAARAVAMLSYRSYEDFTIKQSDPEAALDNFRASSYVQYQGKKFKDRFKASAYFTLSKSMDSHDVGRGRGDLKSALNEVKAKTLVVGVDSDLLFPLTEQEFLSNHIPDAGLGVIRSQYGHDAFLIEYEQLNNILNDFLFGEINRFKPTVLKTEIPLNQ